MENELAEAAELLGLCKPYKVISLVGLSKHSGKTACLRSLVSAGRAQGAKGLAVTSVGHGGEVRLFEGMVAATAAKMLAESDFTPLIKHTTGINTPLGEVVICEALSNGRAGLAGPSINSQLKELCHYLLTKLEVSQVLVDGSGDKRTFAAESDAVILCAGAAFSKDMRRVARECAFVRRIMSIGAMPSDEPGDFIIREIPGALTGEILAGIADSGDIGRTAVVVADSSRIFLEPRAFDSFITRGGRIFAKKRTNLIAVALNPVAPGYSFDLRDFRAVISEYLDVPIFI